MEMGKKAIAMLRAPSDMEDRDVIDRAMSEKGIREDLVVKVKEALRKSRITEEEREESFWMAKGIRQGCLLNPIFPIC